MALQTQKQQIHWKTKRAELVSNTELSLITENLGKLISEISKVLGRSEI